MREFLIPLLGVAGVTLSLTFIHTLTINHNETHNHFYPPPPAAVQPQPLFPRLHNLIRGK